MKKGLLSLFIILIILLIGGTYYYAQHDKEVRPSFIHTPLQNQKYMIQKAGKIVASADTEVEAIQQAKQHKRSIVINTYNDEWVYSSFKPFMILTDTAIHDFETFREAVYYAKTNHHTKIYYKDNRHVIWESQTLKETQLLEVPLVLQLPELPRGCEVSSLAMIMAYSGKEVDKLELAQNIQKETDTYKREGNRIWCGNPYKGFVGDMYQMEQFGYGVYHEPIANLAKNYFGERVIDLTGLDFEEISYFLKKGYPVWLITNSTFKPLEDAMFEIWHTSSGIVKITYRLHAVVLTGIDERNVYINDPLVAHKNIAHEKEGFIKAWEQMGNQAIIIID